MNVLDENIISSQRQELQRGRIPFRQIGYELADQGAKDREIIPLLLQLKQPTFFTRDFDFYDRALCHSRYCLAWLNVRPDDAAVFIRRFLRHPEFATHYLRLGRVVRIHPQGVDAWERGQRQVKQLHW
jgi:hypothetical protein